MAYEFVETLTFEMPSVEEQLDRFSESAFKESHGLVIQIAAIHAGMTANYNNYSSESLEGSLESWTTPYEKPIILNHDLYTEPLGRIIGAAMAKESDGSSYVSLQAAITDPIAIQKVTDRRYLTGSVGGRADEALCSVCSTDWAKPKEGAGLPCRHQRGKFYNGQVAFMDMKNVHFHEYSFVNVPADKRSKVLATASESFTPARFFLLDLEHEGVYEYRESEEPRDILAEKKKKEATPLYLNMKGAYIAALSEAETQEDLEKDGVNSHIDHTNSDRSTEETVMADKADQVEETEEDDILAVSEGLSDDLSKISDEEATATEEEEATDEVAAEEEAGPEDEEDPEEEPTTSDDGEEVAGEESEEEGERPEAQEKPKDKDVDPETSDGAPVSRESEEEETPAEEAKEANTEEPVEETELNEESDNTDVEPLVEELKSEVEALKEENARLKKALHKTLVERVVDAKISAGAVKYEDRASAIEEHSTRTASSLRDTYLDFAALAPKGAPSDLSELAINDESQVVGEEKNADTIGEEDRSDKKQPTKKTAEDILVDALSGRISLQY